MFKILPAYFSVLMFLLAFSLTTWALGLWLVIHVTPLIGPWWIVYVTPALGPFDPAPLMPVYTLVWGG